LNEWRGIAAAHIDGAGIVQSGCRHCDWRGYAVRVAGAANVEAPAIGERAAEIEPGTAGAGVVDIHRAGVAEVSPVRRAQADAVGDRERAGIAGKPRERAVAAGAAAVIDLRLRSRERNLTTARNPGEASATELQERVAAEIEAAGQGARCRAG